MENVTDGDGVAVLDHPAARFVGEHRTPVLTSMMKAVSAAGGPAGVTVCALTVGVLLGAAWRSWTPWWVFGILWLAVDVSGWAGITGLGSLQR